MELNQNNAVCQLGLLESKAYLYASLFILGNILFPQLCHLVPNGGQMLLPIYFFTLIAAYRFGFGVGLLTAVGSPLVNHFLFGMPATGVLALLIVKSVLLAVIAATVAQWLGRATLFGVAFAVIASQMTGILLQWLFTLQLSAAVQSVYVAVPGIVLQVFGGWLLLRKLSK